ncbi:MAG: PHP domain-containing protein [Eubacteriales bacterium]|nr:PHP domain-containing protein [Eubacteriales bacterium]
MKFDLHCHTTEGSIDARIHIREYAEILKSKGFDGMLVTDHDSYRGYEHWLKHRDEMPEGFIVLKGIEYDTCDAGHVLVIMPDDVHLSILTVRGMKLEVLIKLVHSYGGVLGLAHPFGMQGASCMYYGRFLKNMHLIKDVDFLEGFNTCETIRSNVLARSLADRYGLQCTGGSDSHVAKYVGTAYTEFDRPITCNNDLIAAVKEYGIADFGGVERRYLKKHHKRYSATATWSFRTYNQSLGLIFKPYRVVKLKALGIC